MKKIINNSVEFIAWASVLYTAIALILTVSTMYNIAYIYLFSNYRMLQIGIVVMMFAWGIRFLVNSQDRKIALKNGLLCFFYGAGILYFMIINVV